MKRTVKMSETDG